MSRSTLRISGVSKASRARGWNWILAAVIMAGVSLTLNWAQAAKSNTSFYTEGLELYKAGRNSEAVDAFEQAIKRKDNPQASQRYIDRIRKETVERIRNKALTGVNKSTWQNKYYFMNQIDSRVRVGISLQEVFERDSTNFRGGALAALADLAGVIARAESAHFDIELVSEMSSDTQAGISTLSSQQLTAVFSYLSVAARNIALLF